MQSRLFNEIRAGEIFGGWLKSTPELDVKKIAGTKRLMKNTSTRHSLKKPLRSKGATPHDYQVLPAQMAMFNAFEGLTETVERIAAFPMAGEGVADYFIAKSLTPARFPAGSPRPIKKSTKTKKNMAITHLRFSSNTRRRRRNKINAARAVAMSLLLRRAYLIISIGGCLKESCTSEYRAAHLATNIA